MTSTEFLTMADVRARLTAADPKQELAPCGIRQLRLGSGTITLVGSTIADVLGIERDAQSDGSPKVNVVLLVDETLIVRQEQDVKALVEAQLGEHFAVRKEVLSDGHSQLHVSEEVVETAARAATGAHAVVGVGGGTISDIAKLAGQRSGAQAVVVVQTAASVDGYTDDVSVILREGVKRTVPSRWPEAVIADVETIAGAPPVMNRAGYGEMTSMFTAPADWRLASLLGVDPSFHPGAISLLETAGQDIGRWSPGIRQGELGAVERLTAALAARGIVTGVAGTTACLSGIEHLVSHMIDLHHGERGLAMGLHGAQVGVAAVVAAASWEMLLDRLATVDGTPRIDESTLEPTAAQKRVEQAFADLDPTGRIGAECWTDYSRKLRACAERMPLITAVLNAWPRHEPELRALTRPSADIAGGLRAAGSAVAFNELDPVVGSELASWAVANCALMRNRLTAVDLLTLLGWWRAQDVAEVFSRVQRSVPPIAPETEVTHVG